MYFSVTAGVCKNVRTTALYCTMNETDERGRFDGMKRTTDTRLKPPLAPQAQYFDYSSSKSQLRTDALPCMGFPLVESSFVSLPP